MNQHYENIHRYDFLTKDIIEEEYVINGLSDQQIATKFGMPSKAAVWRKRKKFGIDNRYAAKSNKHATKARKFNITKEKALQLLSDGNTYAKIAEYMGCSIVVAKRRFKELGLTNCQEHAEHYVYWDVELSTSQKQMIVGSVLGDGTLTTSGAYSCSHSIKQKEYHEHKREVLSSIHSGKFQHAVHKAQGVSGEHHESLHFTTGCNKFCSEMKPIFYPKGKKVFPYQYLMENMEAEALAYWYMDDGSNKTENRTTTLCTYGYTVLEQILIKDFLLNAFNLSVKIYPRRTRGDYYIYFPALETPKLFDLIHPYIIDSMKYKIYNKEYAIKKALENATPKQIALADKMRPFMSV